MPTNGKYIYCADEERVERSCRLFVPSPPQVTPQQDEFEAVSAGEVVQQGFTRVVNVGRGD